MFLRPNGASGGQARSSGCQAHVVHFGISTAGRCHQRKRVMDANALAQSRALQHATPHAATPYTGHPGHAGPAPAVSPSFSALAAPQQQQPRRTLVKVQDLLDQIDKSQRLDQDLHSVRSLACSLSLSQPRILSFPRPPARLLLLTIFLSSLAPCCVLCALCSSLPLCSVSLCVCLWLCILCSISPHSFCSRWPKNSWKT